MAPSSSKSSSSSSTASPSAAAASASVSSLSASRLGLASCRLVALPTSSLRPRPCRASRLVALRLGAVGRLQIDHVAQQDLALADRVPPADDRAHGQRALAQRLEHRVAAGLDPLGDLDLALARRAARSCPSRAGTCAPDRRCGRDPPPTMAAGVGILAVGDSRSPLPPPLPLPPSSSRATLTPMSSNMAISSSS